MEYAELDRGELYQNWKLVRISTPMDGHCLFHALLKGFYQPYISSTPEERVNMVKEFRKALANRLDGYYNIIQNGNLSEYSKNAPEFTLDSMKLALDSDTYIGYGYLEYISDRIGKNIYIIKGETNLPYISDEITVKEGRPCIVVLHMDYGGGHYELIGIKEGDIIQTHFSYNHSFIRHLNSNMKVVKGE